MVRTEIRDPPETVLEGKRLRMSLKQIIHLLILCPQHLFK